MRSEKRQQDVTLLDVLIDGFEKNEILGGFHWRDLPMPDEAGAVEKFHSLAEEAKRWKGAPIRSEEHAGRRLVAWPDMEIRQVGRGIMVRAKAPWFSSWWHDSTTWAGDPMGPIFDWIKQDANGHRYLKSPPLRRGPRFLRIQTIARSRRARLLKKELHHTKAVCRPLLSPHSRC